jgi:hypothetical protein
MQMTANDHFANFMTQLPLRSKKTDKSRSMSQIVN